MRKMNVKFSSIKNNDSAAFCDSRISQERFSPSVIAWSIRSRRFHESTPARVFRDKRTIIERVAIKKGNRREKGLSKESSDTRYVGEPRDVSCDTGEGRACSRCTLRSLLHALQSSLYVLRDVRAARATYVNAYRGLHTSARPTFTRRKISNVTFHRETRKMLKRCTGESYMAYAGVRTSRDAIALLL